MIAFEAHRPAPFLKLLDELAPTLESTGRKVATALADYAASLPVRQHQGSSLLAGPREHCSATKILWSRE
jgi:hypothetical protein